MHHVPPELLSTILGYVDEAQDHRICHYAPVSQIWKAAVEHVTFRSLRLSSSDLDAFQEAFEGNKCSRREHLRHIYIQCPFPEFEQESQDKCCKVTRKFISEADSTTWSGLIGRLFLTLGDITQRYGVQAEKLPLISLNFLSKKKYPYEENYESRCRFRKHSEREIEEARAKPGTIKLRGSQLLPSLSFVSSLSAHCHGESQFLHPSWIGELAEKLPKLQDVHISVEDAYNWGTNWRKQYHRDLLETLRHLPTTTLETIHIKTYATELRVESIPVPKLSIPGSGTHMYDRTLRWLSNFNQLRILYLTGPVSVTPSLFDIQDTISNNLFPCLDEFALEFTPQTADGRWFFLRDDVAFRNRTPKQLAHDEARDAQRNRLKWTIYGETQVAIRSVKPWCKFRSVPNPETFTPFLCSAARLCSNMPRIKQFSLKLNNNHRNTISRLDYECVDRIFELWFFAAERSLETISDETERPEIPIDVRILHHDRVYFRVGRNPPDNTVVQSWRGVVGRYGKMNFLDEQHCHPLYYGTRRMAYSGEILQEM